MVVLFLRVSAGDHVDCLAAAGEVRAGLLLLMMSGLGLGLLLSSLCLCLLAELMGLLSELLLLLVKLLLLGAMHVANGFLGSGFGDFVDVVGVVVVGGGSGVDTTDEAAGLGVGHVEFDMGWVALCVEWVVNLDAVTA